MQAAFLPEFDWLPLIASQELDALLGVLLLADEDITIVCWQKQKTGLQWYTCNALNSTPDRL